MHQPTRRAAVLLSLFLLLGAQSTQPSTKKSADWRFRILGRQVVDTIEENFYDAGAAKRWADRHRDYADAAEDRETFAKLTRAALAELKVSHLAYWTPDDPQYWAMLAIFGQVIPHATTKYEGIGIDASDDGFVRVVFGGSPAAAAKLKRGDKILLADGQPFHPVKSFRRKVDADVVLTVRRRAAEPPIELTVRPRLIDAGREWLEHQQLYSRIMKRNGKRIAYVPMFCGAGEQYEAALRHALADELNDADALVLDFRYGWGGLSPGFVDIFHERRPVMTRVHRDGQRQVVDRPWTKPVYILTGPGTRSGKEIVCHALQKHRRATLVGEPTAGAVLGGSPRLMRDGAILMTPVEDVLCDGERLEGRPIKPDVETKDAIEFADGADPVLEAALKLASTTDEKRLP
jgi:carboxyl-terminal processing protease